MPAPVAPGPAGTPPQDDSHPSLLKHPDLLLLAVLFPDAFEDDWRNANWAYYEPRTTHDAVPSPCIHSIAASDIGLPLKAYAYFRKTAFLDLENSPGQAAAGLHMAALGGTWLAVARGFMGLDLTGDQPRIRPRLPENWRRLSMQIQHHGRWYRLEATGNDGRVQPCLEDAPPEERPLSAVPAGLNQTATDQHPDSPTGLPAKENEP